MTERHELTLEQQLIADQWMARCSCGWRSVASLYDYKDHEAPIVLRARHSSHVEGCVPDPMKSRPTDAAMHVDLSDKPDLSWP